MEFRTRSMRFMRSGYSTGRRLTSSKITSPPLDDGGLVAIGGPGRRFDEISPSDTGNPANGSIDGVVQLIPSAADRIILRNAHRRRSNPPSVRLRCPCLGDTAMSVTFDYQQIIEITAHMLLTHPLRFQPVTSTFGGGALSS